MTGDVKPLDSIHDEIQELMSSPESQPLRAFAGVLFDLLALIASQNAELQGQLKALMEKGPMA